MNDHYTFSIKVSNEESTNLVNKVLNALDENQKRLASDIKVITIKLARCI